MSKVLIVAEHLDGKLNSATANCVSAAQALQPESSTSSCWPPPPPRSPPKPRRSPASPRC